MEGSVSEHLEAAAEAAHTNEVEEAVEEAVEAIEDVEEAIADIPTTAELEHMMHECIQEETPAIAAAVADVLRAEFADVEEAVEQVEEAVEDVVEEAVEEAEEAVEEDEVTDVAPEPDTPPERTHWLHRRFK